MSRPAASMEVPLRFLGSDHADIAIDDNDPLTLLCAAEEMEDDVIAAISPYPSRCAMLSAWVGRIYRSSRED
jgi:hypothetical protein